MLVQTDKKSVVSTLDWKPSVAEAVVALGRKHHGHYEILPVQGVIDKPIVLDIPGDYQGWTAIPIEMDDSYIPPEARRQERIVRENFTVLQTIILHEPKPVEEPKPQRDYTKVKEVGTVLGNLTVAGVALAAGLIYVLGMGLLYDPALCVVTEDGTWIILIKWEI